jgi:NTP pyrophosphatase (non-canonical NTP hydrolase)
LPPRTLRGYPDDATPKGGDADATRSQQHVLSELGSQHVTPGPEASADGPVVRPENQNTVSVWANETFGPPGSNLRVAARANEEMAELLRALSTDDNHPKALEECADIVIVLYRLVTCLGGDLETEIARKMATNRQRVWKNDGSGHGYHVREKAGEVA